MESWVSVDWRSSNLASCDYKDQTWSLNCLVLHTELFLYRMLSLDSHVLLLLVLLCSLQDIIWIKILCLSLYELFSEYMSFYHIRSMCLVNSVYRCYNSCSKVCFLWSALPTAPHSLNPFGEPLGTLLMVPQLLLSTQGISIHILNASKLYAFPLVFRELTVFRAQTCGFLKNHSWKDI